MANRFRVNLFFTSARLFFTAFLLLSSTRVFAQSTVTVSGSFSMPFEIIEERGADIVLIDLDGSTGFENFWATVDREARTFTVEVPPGKYAVNVMAGGAWITEENIEDRYIGGNGIYFSATSVDATGDDVTNVVVPEPMPHRQFFTTVPPVASLISVGPADGSGIAMVTGSPGAADGPATVAIVNLQTGQRTFGTSETDGSFVIPMFAPEGSYLAIHHDITGNMVFANDPSLTAGTIVRVPVPGEENGAFATGAKLAQNGEFSTAQLAAEGGVDVGQIWLWGEIADRDWSADQSGTLTGTAKIYSRNIANQTPNMHGSRVYLERIFDGDGKQELPNPEQASHFLTPTGLPIERRNGNDPIEIGWIELGEFNQTSDRSGETTWSLDYQLPSNLPDGVYQLVLAAGGDDNIEPLVSGLESGTRYTEGVFAHIFDKLFATGAATLINVNANPNPRLSLALGMNTLSNGSRGTVALEDRDRLAIAPHIKTHSRDFIVPIENSETGKKYKYSLEPFAPLTGSGNRGWINPPTVPFDFSSGELTVQVKQPDGSVLGLGTAAGIQAYLQGATHMDSHISAGNRPGQYFGLTSLNPDFAMTFSQYGLHTVTITGHVLDIFGTRYDVSGTFEVHVAKTLDLEFGVYPNTPFEVGDHFAPGLIVQPGVAADVEIHISHFPNSDPAQKIEHAIRGSANRFGYFHADPEEVLLFEQPGEYRVDYTASFQDSNGVLWMGSRTWGSVVATPNSSIVTRGRRGGDVGGSNEKPLWFNLKGNDLVEGSHLHFPFANGDIVWMEDDRKENEHAPGGSTAMLLMASLQDPTGRLASYFRDRVPSWPNYPMISNTWEIEDRITLGEIPLWSSSNSELSPLLIPDAPGNHWAYFYGGAAKPGVAVREAVTEDDSGNTYWRFDDPYHLQPGNGRDGDRPNDFKFLFAGAVYRAPDEDFYYYGGHGSLWVMLPYSDTLGGRTMPPFQGNGGGPSGGPIMTLEGQDIDMFLHPMGVRPGSILEVGDVASFSGQVAPTLESEVVVRIVSPSGVERFVTGNSNKIGYFYDPAGDFVVDEPGVWRVRVTTTFRGQTSAGPVSEPYPKGGILGSEIGRYHFYVVQPDSSPLEVDIPAHSWVQPGKNAIQLPLLPTHELTDVRVHRTTVMPGFLLEEADTPNTTYVYNAQALHEDFPNLDIMDGEMRYGTDTITMSFLVSGKDGNGETVYRARQVLLQGEELMAPEQAPSAFAINAGVNDAWVHEGAPNQGIFLTAFPDLELMFAAWFTFDSERPGDEASATIGAPDQRWITALGSYSGSTATLAAELTTGGRFNSNAGEIDQDTSYGTIEIDFANCSAANISYDFPSTGLSGAFEANRVLNDNVVICEGLSNGSINPSAVAQATRPSGVKSDHFVINPGMNDAWVNPDAGYQGMFLTVFPEYQLLFAAWFVFDDQEPQPGITAELGAPDQRWLTAFGSYSGTSATLKIENTTGGVFESDNPKPEQNSEYGTLQIDFSDCSNATVSIDIPSASQSQSFALERILGDNVGLCELLGSP